MPNSAASNTTPEILLSGAFAAFTIDLLIYPLDTLKTRIQSKDYGKRYLAAATQRVNRALLFRGLYQGVGSVIIATLPSSGVFFLSYESIKSLLATSSSLPAPLTHALASSLAELASCAILTPAEVIKQNAQMRPAASRGFASSLQTLARFRSRPAALFRGYTALAARNLPFTALQFPVFERLKRDVKRRRQVAGTWTGSLREHALVTAGSAGVAGSVAAVLTTPIDVVKTRVMLQAGESGGGEGGGGRESAARVVRGIVAEKGVRGLWRGGALRGVWTMVGSGLYLGVYDFGRVYLAKRRGVDVSDQDFF